MKLFAISCVLLFPLAAVPFASAADVTVTLQIDLVHRATPSYKECDVTLPAGSTVGALLDQAAADGCISSWESSSFPGFGRYVTCLDGLCEQIVTYWAFYVNGHYASAGIDDTPVTAGSTYTFVYEQWAVQLPPL